ncbi:hypothetical protein DVA67_021395 [Solirubrobacter sp. CPCC 204708]|uniref:Uncharacterized protein n=1 Tax=Solirubrobacter deserti TaxID=2282478 RepID=A0ABT4RET6_9ACTN|nr:hypothetical protein [Solirubrobacter deserti]MBE2318550.1 hypothetical protein [Solirubrobacter deserti]MDA0137008.1 hypothetical protein [Solirubrobacter deserti]
MRSTAGQATIEYVAAIALIAALLVVAAPAVGAPSVAAAVVAQMERALCIAGLDICDARMARDAGLAPCPLKTDVTGHEATGTAFSIELGHRLTLTVTPNSDGTVTVVRSASGTAGGSGGVGYDVAVGPVAFQLGGNAGLTARVQAARAWVFPDQAAADEFLRHAVVNGFRWERFPPAWNSIEGGEEVSAALGLAFGGKEQADLIGVAASGQAALGARIAPGRVVTVYGRVATDGPELQLPLTPSTGLGKHEWLAEVTFGPDGPRELAFRHAAASELDSRVTETVSRLDLRDPANRAVAAPLLAMKWPWRDRAALAAAAERISTHGTIERTVSSVEDDTRGISGSVKGGWKFGGSVKRIKVHRSLVSASARAGGFERQRYDCVK